MDNKKDAQKIGILIVAYNRPDYLQQCLDSLIASEIPPGTIILLLDDCSTDTQVGKIIAEAKGKLFHVENIKYCAVRNPINWGIRGCLECGIETLFNVGCDVVINLDGDAIVKPEFINRLVDLKNKHPTNIVSGFNAISTVNPIITQHDDCCVKGYANGINMCFDNDRYKKYIKPALNIIGNWDYNTSLNCRAHDLPFYVTTPSVVQHIGLISSMGHGHGEKADQAHDF